MASAKGVRVINMSFAGPRIPRWSGPSRRQHDKGIVLIAAAAMPGRNRRRSNPGADPNGDRGDGRPTSRQDLHGRQSRPLHCRGKRPRRHSGAGARQYLSTDDRDLGRLREVSGLVALLLGAQPNLGPEDVRKILTSSARRRAARIATTISAPA